MSGPGRSALASVSRWLIARAYGVEQVLMICDDDNAGSRTVIEACGGQLESVEDVRGTPIRRYWID